MVMKKKEVKKRPVDYLPLVAGGGLALVLVGLGLMLNRETEVELPNADGGSPAIARNRTQVIGGVRRPVSDFERQSQRDIEGEDAEYRSALGGFGTTPLVDPDANEATKAVMHGLTDKENGSTSTWNPMQVPVFDRAEYERDPKAYLDRSVPGRVWAPAQPGPGVPVLARRSSRRESLRQGESVRLKVGVPSGSPVTFTSFDLGSFENQLTSITVAADSDGVATAVFTATSGTIGRVNVLAASPLAAGRSRFQLDVLP